MITKSDLGLILKIKLTPNAKFNAVLGFENGELRISVVSPPVDEKANSTLIAFLAKLTKVKKRNIEIISGRLSRHKKILFREVVALPEFWND